mgnify:CR=1 FL=1
MLTTSVALATYNGSKYIEDQIRSILYQSRLPDQLLISDDFSQDDTLAKITSVLHDFDLNFQIVTSSYNAGYSRNFERALQYCTEDIIFCCDQDDVWFLNKIDLVVSYFDQNESVMLLIHDLEFCTETLLPTGKFKLHEINNLYNTNRSYVTGMATAARREFIDFCLPIPFNIPYDLWIHSCAFYLDVKLILSETLAYYRRHHSNATNSDHLNFSFNSRFKYYLKILRNELSRKEISSSFNLPELVLNRIYDRENFLFQHLNFNNNKFNEIIQSLNFEKLLYFEREKIKNLPFHMRLPKIYDFYSKGYYSYFSGYSSLLKDLISP